MQQNAAVAEVGLHVQLDVGEQRLAARLFRAEHAHLEHAVLVVVFDGAERPLAGSDLEAERWVDAGVEALGLNRLLEKAVDRPEVDLDGVLAGRLVGVARDADQAGCGDERDEGGGHGPLVSSLTSALAPSTWSMIHSR